MEGKPILKLVKNEAKKEDEKENKKPSSKNKSVPPVKNVKAVKIEDKEAKIKEKYAEYFNRDPFFFSDKDVENLGWLNKLCSDFSDDLFYYFKEYFVSLITEHGCNFLTALYVFKNIMYDLDKNELFADFFYSVMEYVSIFYWINEDMFEAAFDLIFTALDLNEKHPWSYINLFLNTKNKDQDAAMSNTILQLAKKQEVFMNDNCVTIMEFIAKSIAVEIINTNLFYNDKFLTESLFVFFSKDRNKALILSKDKKLQTKNFQDINSLNERQKECVRYQDFLEKLYVYTQKLIPEELDILTTELVQSWNTKKINAKLLQAGFVDAAQTLSKTFSDFSDDELNDFYRNFMTEIFGDTK